MVTSFCGHEWIKVTSGPATTTTATYWNHTRCCNAYTGIFSSNSPQINCNTSICKSCDMMNYTNGKMRWMLPFTETECSKSSFYVTHGTQQHQRVDCDQVIYSHRLMPVFNFVVSSNCVTAVFVCAHAVCVYVLESSFRYFRSNRANISFHHTKCTCTACSDETKGHLHHTSLNNQLLARGCAFKFDVCS